MHMFVDVDVCLGIAVFAAPPHDAHMTTHAQSRSYPSQWAGGAPTQVSTNNVL